MCTPHQTVRRNYACSIDETAYMQARLAGKYLVVYKEEVELQVGSSSETVGSLEQPDNFNEQSEIVNTTSLSKPVELEVFNRSLLVLIAPKNIGTQYFSSSTSISQNSTGIGYIVYPLLTGIIRCRGSPFLLSVDFIYSDFSIYLKIYTYKVLKTL